MRARRGEPGEAEPAGDVFEEIVVPCIGREEAQAEAERRQAEDSAEATWIYLRVDGQWVAKRTPTDMPKRRQRSFGGTLLGEIIENL
jgi:hypothetical protein